jgi:peptidyl-prolyl cis-trans isomerase C
VENKILATVGGMAITDADVDKFLMSLGQRGAGYNTPEGRAMVLEELIDTKLLLLDAKRNLIEGEAEFRARLAEIKDKLLVNYAAEKVLKTAKTPRDEELLAYYNENTEKFVTGESVNANHILVDTEERALEIYEEISSGKKSFEDAAKEYSSCPSSQQGGSLGDFGRGQMVPEFDSAVFSMSVGEVTSAPVKTQFGYHLIKLNSKNESETAPFEAVKESIRTALTQENQKKAYESKINQLKIMYPVDKNI